MVYRWLDRWRLDRSLAYPYYIPRNHLGHFDLGTLRASAGAVLMSFNFEQEFKKVTKAYRAEGIEVEVDGFKMKLTPEAYKLYKRDCISKGKPPYLEPSEYKWLGETESDGTPIYEYTP